MIRTFPDENGVILARSGFHAPVYWTLRSRTSLLILLLNTQANGEGSETPNKSDEIILDRGNPNKV